MAEPLKIVKLQCPHCDSDDTQFLFQSGGMWECKCCSKLFDPKNSPTNR